MSEHDPAFGTYALNVWQLALRNFIARRRRGRFFARQLRSTVRRLMLLGHAGPVDVAVFGKGSAMRLHYADNLTDKNILTTGGWWDLAERRALSDLIEASEGTFTFADVGANTGAYSIWVATQARRFGRDYRVLAIEPDTITRARLTFNIAASDMGERTAIDPRAVSDRSEDLVVVVRDARNRGQNRMAQSEGAQDSDSIAALTLTQMLAEHGMSAIDAIKVDVEGYDYRVLSRYLADAADDDLARLVIAEYTSVDAEALRSAFKARGYEIVHTGIQNIICRRDR